MSEKEPVITTDAWLADIERLRGKPKYEGMTDEQFRFMVACRESERQVKWNDVAQLWEKYFGEKISTNTLVSRYEVERAKRNLS